jgi:hypothetical protein
VAAGSFGALVAAGSFGALVAAGSLGALVAAGSFGALVAAGSFGALVAAGSFVALRPRILFSLTKSLFAEAEAARAERKSTVVENPVFIILDLYFH